MTIKKELVTLSKLIEEKGFVNAYEGNISIMDRKNKKVYFTPSGTRKLTLTEEMIAVLDENEKQIEGTLRHSSEYKLHLAAYKFCEDCNAVIHAHSPYLTAFAMLGKEIYAECSAEFLTFGGKIPVVPWGEKGTYDIIGNLGELLQDYKLVLLECHGVLCVDKDLETCFKMLEAAENTVHSWIIATQIGTPKSIPVWNELLKKTKKN